jgi:hypothetical protein
VKVPAELRTVSARAQIRHKQGSVSGREASSFPPLGAHESAEAEGAAVRSEIRISSNRFGPWGESWQTDANGGDDGDLAMAMNKVRRYRTGALARGSCVTRHSGGILTQAAPVPTQERQGLYYDDSAFAAELAARRRRAVLTASPAVWGEPPQPPAPPPVPQFFEMDYQPLWMGTVSTCSSWWASLCQLLAAQERSIVTTAFPDAVFIQASLNLRVSRGRLLAFFHFSLKCLFEPGGGLYNCDIRFGACRMASSPRGIR